MSVEECMEKVSIREFRVWMHRLKEEVFVPSRTDWYLMRVCATIEKLYRVKVQSREPISLDDFRIKSEEEEKRSLDKQKENTIALAKKRAMARVGYKEKKE